MDNKIKLSNKIYPYFYGISSDLLFFIAIDTIFLAIVKGYSDAQINFLTAFSMITVLIFQPINLKIIKKICNINSIKLGMLILLLGALLITFSSNYYITLIGYGLYEVAYIFKSMENVVLKRNLVYLGKSNDFVKIQSKGATVYSVITLIISLIAGYLFTINNYLPMYLCISCCVLNIIFSQFLCETHIASDENKKKESKFKFTKIIILIVLVYSIGYSMMALAQSNSKLFMQGNMLNILDVQKTSMYLVIIIAISRVVRVVSNLVFPKVYNKLKDKILYLTIILFIIAHVFVLLGGILFSMFGIYVMCVGYFVYLAIRDPYQTYIKELLLNNCNKEDQEKAITILALAKNIQKLIFSSIITLTLLKFDLKLVFIMFLILSLIEFIICIELYKLLGGKNGKNE